MSRRRLTTLLGAGVLAYLLMVAAPLAIIIAVVGGGLGVNGLCGGPGGQPDTAGGGGGNAALTGSDQLAYAQLITSVTAQRGLPQQAAVVAIATAAQESRLGQAGMNVAVDHDSLGLFQQRPSSGWGTPAQIKDPNYATNKFLDALIGIGDWITKPITVAAQTVQRSAFPDAYAKWEAQARDLAARFWPPGVPVGGNPAAAARVGTQAAPDGAGAQACPGNGGDGLAPGQGSTAVPPGFVPPSQPQQAAVVRTALAQLGKPYQWGGTGPAAFDCSGLMVAAWREGGVTIPRTAAVQSTFGAPVATLAQAQPGDLVFIAGALGTPDRPGHVGMYLGNDQIINAPQEGDPVQIIPASKWAGKITGIRRPGSAAPDAPAPAAGARAA